MEAWGLIVGFFAIAVLYSSVGHGGASGYLAVMTFFGLTSVVMRPTALTLNILVSALAVVHFARAGWFDRRLFWPFAVASVPAAALGGALALTETGYRWVVGVVLLFAAAHLFWSATKAPDDGVRPPPFWTALAIGVALGLLSGLTGVGGGIFLSPLLLAAGWAGPRETAAASAAFILVNSIAGLSAHLATIGSVPQHIGWFVVATGLGGFVGSRIGSRRLGGAAIRRLLAVVVFIAAIKFLAT